jgi:hypothetical protein
LTHSNLQEKAVDVANFALSAFDDESLYETFYTPVPKLKGLPLGMMQSCQWI